MSKTISSPLRTSLLQSAGQGPSSPILASPFKRKTMTITQTYYLAHKARAKLSSEAGRPDHNLRLLVGHANLLDSLMLELADAEREQESWFNHSVRGATKSTEERHVQWADTIVEDPEEDWRVEDADSDSSSDSESDVDEEEDIVMADIVPLRRVPSQRWTPPKQSELDAIEEDEDDFEDDDEDYPYLALSRTASHSASQLPELDHDSDSSEDEPMPPSPPTAVLETFSEKQKEAISSSRYYDSSKGDKQKSFYEEGFYLPPRNPARLVTAISVY